MKSLWNKGTFRSSSSGRKQHFPCLYQCSQANVRVSRHSVPKCDSFDQCVWAQLSLNRPLHAYLYFLPLSSTFFRWKFLRSGYWESTQIIQIYGLSLNSSENWQNVLGPRSFRQLSVFRVLSLSVQILKTLTFTIPSGQKIVSEKLNNKQSPKGFLSVDSNWYETTGQSCVVLHVPLFRTEAVLRTCVNEPPVSGEKKVSTETKWASGHRKLFPGWTNERKSRNQNDKKFIRLYTRWTYVHSAVPCAVPIKNRDI